MNNSRNQFKQIQHFSLNKNNAKKTCLLYFDCFDDNEIFSCLKIALEIICLLSLVFMHFTHCMVTWAIDQCVLSKSM